LKVVKLGALWMISGIWFESVGTEKLYREHCQLDCWKHAPISWNAFASASPLAASATPTLCNVLTPSSAVQGPAFRGWGLVGYADLPWWSCTRSIADSWLVALPGGFICDVTRYKWENPIFPLNQIKLMLSHEYWGKKWRMSWVCKKTEKFDEYRKILPTNKFWKLKPCQLDLLVRNWQFCHCSHCIIGVNVGGDRSRQSSPLPLS
jgi:hypothetical protein